MNGSIYEWEYMPYITPSSWGMHMKSSQLSRHQVAICKHIRLASARSTVLWNIVAALDSYIGRYTVVEKNYYTVILTEQYW